MSDEITIDELKRGLLAAGDAVSSARDELCELDAMAGDGDLGVTLATGFAAVEEVLGTWEGTDAGDLFRTAGVTLARSAAATIGVLFATAFMRIGKELDGVERLDAEHVATLLATAASSVAERGGAEPGQRTVLDAMDSAASEARAAALGDLGTLEVLRQGATGAVAGAAATSAMEPRHGRAGWIADRARGREDAGARAWAVYLVGLADALDGGVGAAGTAGAAETQV